MVVFQYLPYYYYLLHTDTSTTMRRSVAVLSAAAASANHRALSVPRATSMTTRSVGSNESLLVRTTTTRPLPQHRHQQLHSLCGALRRFPPVLTTAPSPSLLFFQWGGNRWHGGGSDASSPTVNVVFLQPDGTTRVSVPARVGDSLLQVAHRHEIDLEGACEGGTCMGVFLCILLRTVHMNIHMFICKNKWMMNIWSLMARLLFVVSIQFRWAVCACSTCHCILPRTVYDTLPDPSEDEEDMLDMAFGLTETSRLGCQVIVTAEMEGIVVEMPKATRNFYVDGHKPKPH